MRRRPYLQLPLRASFALALLIVTLPAAAGAALTEEALELRDRAIAQLENEKPLEAEATYRELIALVPGDPLPHANLAIALLRQQKYDQAKAAIAKALEIAPGRGDLLAIQAEVLQWTGDLEGAVALLERAAVADPDDPEIHYALLNQAGNAGDDEAAGRALDALVRLRPENLVVILQRGRRAIAAGDRATATATFSRVEELLWGAPPIAERAMAMLRDALAAAELEKAAGPAQRLENVLKITPMFRESLRELRTGIQGIPLTRFADEPEATRFGPPIAVRFEASAIDSRPTAGRALAVGDFDGDRKADVARVRAGREGEDATLELRLAAGAWKKALELPAPGIEVLLAADLDNDGLLDLLGFGDGCAAVWLGDGKGALAAAPDALGLASAGASAAAVIDFDIEGDLDVALAGSGAGAASGGLALFRNNLQGPLEPVGALALPAASAKSAAATALRATDLDRDGDLDLVLASERGLRWLDNLRQGRFADRTEAAGLPRDRRIADLRAADLDNDGRPDLITVGQGLTAWRGEGGGRFAPWTLLGTPGADVALDAVLAFDADNDGRLDLAAGGPAGVEVLGQLDRRFAGRKITGSSAPKAVAALAAADLDGDGDLDLLAAGGDGLHRLDNQGGNGNRWLALRLRGLNKGNSKNNLLGYGSTVEVKSGRAYQYLEADGDVVHVGLGDRPHAEVVRVVWTNGVPQNRLRVAGNQNLVETQLLKGSCPFLYAWDGERYAFVTDLLWGAPLGLPVAAGVWAASDPEELVRVDGAVPDDDGRYRLRITEELWEAAFFDHVRLWLVDHPAEVEVASSLRIVPGPSAAAGPDRVLASRRLRPVAAAWDGRGRDVTAAVARRDEIYADGYEKSPYQGVAARPWSFTFDLGAAPAGPLRLVLDGWIFPADASLNLAVDQRGDLPFTPPRLEVEIELGDGAPAWQVLMADFGHPAGKTKTMVVDTPPLPAGARRLRIVTDRWLHWDRIAWSAALPADHEPVVRARLLPDTAELRRRGFSALVRQAPNAPHGYDYGRVVHAAGAGAGAETAPWLPFPGRYTRYGEVAPLLAAADDRSVILAPGDEMALVFDAGALAPPPPGWQRTVFLESHGWDKDADRNTGEGLQLEPLPFRAMSGYPYGPGESFPATPELERYRREWLTREVAPISPR